MSPRQWLMETTWAEVRKSPGWIWTLETLLNLTPTEVEHIEWLEDWAVQADKRVRSWVRSNDRDCRWNVLALDPAERLEALRVDVAALDAEYAELCRRDAVAVERQLLFVCSDLKAKKNEIKRLERAVAVPLEGWTGGFTQEQIDQAKAFPISKLLEVDSRGYAICPFHQDKKPSFWTRGGWGHCFSCGRSCNSLRFLMEVRGVGFREAVKQLCGGGI